MEKTSNVQLHKIIKNSLASYLSYKWSKNKLYLKRRKNKSRREKKNKEKKSTNLEKKHSIINLENDIFIYDAKTKTFTQLDLCDCFRNGLKYRKIDPFNNTQTTKKKYELQQISKNSSEGSRDLQNFPITDIEDSVEQIFSNQLLKKKHWEKAINAICPSKFDLFLQKELNKCNGKNFNVKSFKINSRPDFEANSKNNLRSSAAIGYYKITTYDNALQCDNKQTSQAKIVLDSVDGVGRLEARSNNIIPFVTPEESCATRSETSRSHKCQRQINTVSLLENNFDLKTLFQITGKIKRCNFVDIQKDPLDPKKMYSKGEQCEQTNNNRRASNREEKVVSRNETGIQCFMKSPRNASGKRKIEPIDAKVVEILTHHRKSPTPRQKSHKRKKLPRRSPSSLSDLYPPAGRQKVGNMVKINSSAEIRKILNEKRSSPSFTLSNTGEYFRTFLNSPHPRTLLTYYQTSSSSRDNGGDTYDEQYFKKQHIVVATTSNPISPICSGPCGPRRRQKPPPCNCSCGTSYDAKGGSRKNQNKDMDQNDGSTQRDGSRRNQNKDMDQYDGSTQKEGSADKKDSDTERRKSLSAKRVESQTGSIATKQVRMQSDFNNGESEKTSDDRQKTKPEDAKTGEIVKGQTSEDPKTPEVCVTDCKDSCKARNDLGTCKCCHQPLLNLKKKPCCECPEEMKRPSTVKTKCICDILTCLKERIKLQTEEQNRNLDQILEELNKQDQELKEIRNFVEKYNESKKKTSKPGKVRECSCYAVTVQHDFTTDMTPLPDPIRPEKMLETNNSVHVQETKSSEPEIIELFGSNDTFERKNRKNVSKKESWKALWTKNSEVKAFFVTDFLKKRSIKKKITSSSNTTTDDSESKKIKKDHKHWFSHLFTSKKDLRKNGS